MNPSGEQWVCVARLQRTRGNRGELAAEALTGHPERYSRLSKVRLERPAGSREAEVETVWQHQDRWIFKFRGVDSISAAEELEGCDVLIPLAERVGLEEGEFFLTDLVGCSMIDRRSGALIGRVEGWQETGGPLLLEVLDPAGREILVPFARSICVEIDVAGRRILAELPEGLADLNEPGDDR